MKVLTKASHFISWHRRVIAIALALAGILALSSYLTTDPPHTVAAVTLRHAIPAGDTITGSDVALTRLPPQAVPADALTTIEDAVGHVAITALSKNTILAPSLFRHQHSAAPGRSLVPIALHEPALLPLLSPGTVITLTMSHSDGTDVVTTDAVVVALPVATEQSGPLSPSSPKNVMVVDVPSGVAEVVASLGQQGNLGILLSAP